MAKPNKDRSDSVMSMLSILQQNVPPSKEETELEKAKKKTSRKKKRAVKESNVFQQPSIEGNY